MAIPITRTQAQDADATYIINKIASADKAEAQAHSCTATCRQDRIDAGLRLIEVQSRFRENGSFPEWLKQNGIKQSTAYDLIRDAGATDEQREERKAAERARKNAANAVKKASANSILKDMGVNEGGSRVAIQNAVAAETGIRAPETPEQAEQFRAVAAEIVKAKGTTLADTRAEIKTLPETAQQKLARLESTLTRQLQAEFDERVRKAALKKLPELKAELDAERAECRIELGRWKHRRDGIKSQLTQEEYRLIRQTIASDRYPEEFRAKLDKIAAIINRFGAYVEAWSDGISKVRL